jgi:hypothetical protein
MHTLIVIVAIILLAIVAVRFAKKAPAEVKAVETAAATVADDVKVDAEAAVTDVTKEVEKL